ncbi:MAG: hypothetical protein A2538_02905 [Candidatus Magasanikbacteria bacterium RIFOXYD2_FULL_41_14]|uniref:Uncharacterized protein n=1 Tax=Candidatus Magasanikbacteria bacterium RIFOXYD2_FULL_41_14 TaxID=1798709 RepID=A0A1F6PCC0_9BACT|nr:MAG: hypothetical protein A2538_02905 [Candidatus Magasanikbacteria bacterium RIFOXYD2_FULL_41_14]
MNRTKIIKIKQDGLSEDYNHDIFLVADHYSGYFPDHKEIANKIKDNDPHTITIIINNLSDKFWNNKKYVKKTREFIPSIYSKLLYENFFNEFGDIEGNKLYARWLEKYRPAFQTDHGEKELDDYIIKNELEPRYRDKILSKFKNHEKLFKPRVKINKDRYYNLLQPFNRVDWRNPYDNIFVWESDGKKYYRRGGSGSSGARETNSKFIFGLSLINQLKPIKSYLFLYSDDNRLYFIKKFSSLTVPNYDIGSNYFLEEGERDKTLAGVSLLEWSDFNKLKELRVLIGKELKK